MYCSDVGAALMTWGVDRLYAKKELAVKTLPERAYQQHLICFPLTCWKRNHKSMCLFEQIELGGCVLNGRAPGVLNNDSQSPLVRSVWECSAGEIWMEKSSVQTTACCCLRRAPWASVISRPHCFWTIGTNLPSGWGSLCCAGREALCSYQWRVHLGSHRWTETNEETMLFISAPLWFTLLAWLFIRQFDKSREFKFCVAIRLTWKMTWF